MSLINEVLRDLDRRQPAQAAQSVAETSTAAPERRSGRILLVTGLAVALAAPALWWLSSANHAEPAPASLPFAASGNPDAPSLPPADLPAQTAEAAGPNPLVNSPTAVADASETTLALSPAAAADVSMATTRQSPTPRAAETTPVPAPDEGLPPLQAAVVERPALTALAAPQAEARPSPAEPSRPLSGQAVPQAEALPPSPAADRPTQHIDIRRAERPADQDDPFLEARRALARGQEGLAEDRLRRVLIERPQHAPARLLLAQILIARGRDENAIDLLQTGLEAGSDRGLAGLLGRLLAERGEAGRALSALRMHAPPIEEDPDYHLIVAAVLRQAGDHEGARDHYLAISQAAPSSAAAWIGLGASHESLGEIEAARQAYAEAQYRDRGELGAFADSRLRALN